MRCSSARQSSLTLQREHPFKLAMAKNKEAGGRGDVDTFVAQFSMPITEGGADDEVLACG